MLLNLFNVPNINFIQFSSLILLGFLEILLKKFLQLPSVASGILNERFFYHGVTFHSKHLLLQQMESITSEAH